MKCGNRRTERGPISANGTPLLVRPFLIILAVVILPGASFAAAKKLDKATLVFNFSTNGSHAPYYLSKQKGYYEKEGLAVDILDGSGSATTVKVVGSGAQNFGIASAESIAMGRSVGIPIVAVSVFHQHSPTCFFSLEKSKIRAPMDLVGKRMGLQFTSSTYPMYKAMLRKYKIDDKRIKEIAVGNGVEPLIMGDVDALNAHLDNEPLQVKYKGYPVIVVTYDSLGLRTYGISLVCNETLLKRQPDFVRRFVRATLRGWRETMSNPEEAASYVMKERPYLDRETVQGQAKASVTLLQSAETTKHGLGWQTAGGWRETVELLIETGQIKKMFQIDKMFTNEFIEDRPSTN